MVSETVGAEMLLRTCGTNLVGEVVHKKLSYVKGNSCGNGFRNGLRGNAFADSLWKVKWQPFRNFFCYLDTQLNQKIRYIAEKYFILKFVCEVLIRSLTSQ
ncbi:hypothetical protein AVEN_226961-1 [Araneus ventricosus]|uniref:Uncharacterized protein n=1 Tax=Araneus ventricosus TaxID=182803 RepID=A0A4Y2LHT7_ARAVE|nr:hypothetical protein AVEN_226961-1 [Araneus ventricosus]